MTNTTLEHRVRDIVGGPYDDRMGGPPERHQQKRHLSITAIPGAYEHASHVVIAINGTPTRGTVIVQLTHGDAESRHMTGNRQLGAKELATLKGFIAAAAETSLCKIPAGFHWASEPITTA